MKKNTTTAKTVKTTNTITASAINNAYQKKARIERWIEALPEAVSLVTSCRAMEEGKLLPIQTLERIDGRDIGTIIIANLTRRFIENENGNLDYRVEETYYAPRHLRERCLHDVQFAILHLIDFGAFVPQNKAEKLYKRFYRQGDRYVSDVVSRSILAALERS